MQYKNVFIKVTVTTSNGTEIINIKHPLDIGAYRCAQCRNIVKDYFTSKEWLKDGFRHVYSYSIDYAYYNDMGVQPVIVDNVIV